MQMVVHGKSPQYMKDLMIPSKRLHVPGNKQLLPRTRIYIFKTSFSFSGSLAWNSLVSRKGGRISENGWQRVQFQSPTFPLQCLFQGQFHRLYSPLHCLLKVNSSITRIPYYSVHSDLIPIIRITLSSQAYFRSPAFPVTTPTEG